MNETPRNIKFSTKWEILKKRPVPMLIGFLFTFLPFFFLILFGVVFSSLENDAPEVDYDLIAKNGKEITAKITDIETQNNITVNGVHPTIITYEYVGNENNTIESKYKVLEGKKINKLDIGSQIQIKELNGQSIIKGLKPYTFGLGLMLLSFLPLLIIGIPFLIYSISKMNKELKLYKYGKVQSGKILSMIPKSGLPVSNAGQGIIVHYEYETKNGKKIIGESFTTDFSIINDKKKGDMIPIFVSTENPEKSCIVPKLEALRNNWNINFE